MYRLMCSLNLSPKGLTSLCTPHHIPVYHTYTNILFNFFMHFVLILSCYEDLRKSSISLKYVCMLYLLQMLLNTLNQFLHVRYYYVPFCSIRWFCVVFVDVIAVDVVGFVLCNFLCSILCKAHALYLHQIRTSLRCCCSVLSSSGLELTALDLCTEVLIVLYFAAMWW